MHRGHIEAICPSDFEVRSIDEDISSGAVISGPPINKTTAVGRRQWSPLQNRAARSFTAYKSGWSLDSIRVAFTRLCLPGPWTCQSWVLVSLAVKPLREGLRTHRSRGGELPGVSRIKVSPTQRRFRTRPVEEASTGCSRTYG